MEYRKCVHTPDYDPRDWLINPKIPECSQKYWKLSGDMITEMREVEKTAVDAIERSRADEAAKEALIYEKSRELAIEALKKEGKINEDGTIKHGKKSI
jgi:hypothetical protein